MAQRAVLQFEAFCTTAYCMLGIILFARGGAMAQRAVLQFEAFCTTAYCVLGVVLFANKDEVATFSALLFSTHHRWMIHHTIEC